MHRFLVVAVIGFTLVASGCAGDDREIEAQPELFRQSMEDFGIDLDAAVELAAEVCLIADDADGDYDRAVTEIIAEYGSAHRVRLVTENAEFTCPQHAPDLRFAAIQGFEE